MDVLVKTILKTNDGIFQIEKNGILLNEILTFNDDYINKFDIDNLTLERISDDIHSYFDFNKSKITYFIKDLNSNLDINMKTINKEINENDIKIEYITFFNEEETKCEYTIKWRKL